MNVPTCDYCKHKTELDNRTCENCFFELLQANGKIEKYKEPRTK